MEFLREMLAFLRDRQKVWLFPLILLLVLFGALLVVAKTSALAPFIYTLF